MPCYRCHTRQTDPARGASPWGRAVIGGEQVLVCPDCQREPTGHRAFDRCPTCGSTHLAKALGLVVCRDCGARSEPARSEPARSDTGPARPAGARTGPAGQAGLPGHPGPTGSADLGSGLAGAAAGRGRAGRAEAGAVAAVLPAGAIRSPSGEPDPGRTGGSQAASGPASGDSAGEAGPRPTGGTDLAADVEAALARMFGRGPSRTTTAARRPDEADEADEADDR